MNEPKQGRSSHSVTETNAKTSAPVGRVLVAQGLLMVGIVLLLAAAILVLAVRPFLSQKARLAPEKPVAVVEKSGPPPAPVPAAQSTESPAPAPAPVVEAPPSPALVAEPPPAPAPVAAEPPVPVELPTLVTDAGPDAAIAEYVAKMEVLGYASGQVLLRLPGEEEAHGFREGDVLDDAFPLRVLKVTDRRVSFGDDRGHTYSRSY